jgi:hypothetical protein
MGERTSTAIERIERALARIESAASRPATAAPAGEDVSALREAHRTLRARVEGAVAQIDRLLEPEAGR